MGPLAAVSGREKEMMNENDRALVLEIRKKLDPDVERHLKRLIVFGSRARDLSSEESDLDLFALVDQKSPEIEKKLDDIVYQVMWDHDFRPIISLKVFEESHYKEALSKGFSFYRHVEQEGVAL